MGEGAACEGGERAGVGAGTGEGAGAGITGLGGSGVTCGETSMSPDKSSMLLFLVCDVEVILVELDRRLGESLLEMSNIKSMVL